MARTLDQLAQEALDVQDACNLSGVVSGFSRAIADLREQPGCGGSDWLAAHPVSKLWADKIAHLTNTQLGDGVMGAYDQCYAFVAAGANAEWKR